MNGKRHVFQAILDADFENGSEEELLRALDTVAHSRGLVALACQSR